MRRRFNQTLLPKEPPKKNMWIGKHIGSPFNRWFRAKIKEAKVTNRRFSELIDEPYDTIMTWRYRCDPHVWGQCRIAEGLEALKLGEYDAIRAEIKRLCRGKKRI